MKMNEVLSRFNRKIAPSLKIVAFLTFLIIIILTIPSINAVDLLMQGPNSPGTVVNDNSIGTIPWVNPGNATTSDDADATCNLESSSPNGNYLKATNFGFAIPADATINGILVEFEKDQDAQMNSIYDNAVRIVKGGVIGSTDRKLASQWPTSDTYVSYGSNSDLWGETWTPADINSNGFGVAISPIYSYAGIGTARIDHIRITVYYTMPVGAPALTLPGMLLLIVFVSLAAFVKIRKQQR